MGKDKKTTVNTSNQSSGSSTNMIDPASQQYITNFLRPLGREGVGALLGAGPLFGGPTETFNQGVGAVQAGLGGLGNIGQALRNFRPGVGETGFTPGAIGDGGAMDVYRQALESGGGGINFNARAFDPDQAQAFFSPFQDEVVGSVQANADRQRELALSRAASEATSRGAFGGSRSGLLQAQSLRDVNQDEAAQVAQLRNQGFQTAMQQALGAHQADQSTRLQAAMADQAGRQQFHNLGLRAADIGQRGDIAENEIGLRTALGDLQGRQADAEMGLRRALGLQEGSLQGLGLQSRLAQQLMGAGEIQRQIGNQQRQEPLFRYQNALNLAGLGYGGPLGHTSTFNQRSRGRQQTTEQGDLFGDLLGLGLTAGGFFLGGPAGASAAGGLSGLLGPGGAPSDPFAVMGGADIANLGAPISAPPLVY